VRHFRAYCHANRRFLRQIYADLRRRQQFGEIKEAGFTGDYSRVTEFVRRWRAEGGAAVDGGRNPRKSGGTFFLA
jgi:hypothetical protein